MRHAVEQKEKILQILSTFISPKIMAAEKQNSVHKKQNSIHEKAHSGGQNIIFMHPIHEKGRFCGQKGDCGSRNLATQLEAEKTYEFGA